MVLKTMKTKHAWHSARQAKICGVVLWKNDTGDVLETTIITRTKEHGCKWDDLVYLGEVVEYVGRKTEGELVSLKDASPEDVEKWEQIIEREKRLNDSPHRWN